jgi:PAS domain-containing protein
MNTIELDSKSVQSPPDQQQELFRKNRELAALRRISEIMLSGRPDGEMFDAIAAEIAGVTEFPMVSIELCDFGRAVMIFRGTHGIPLGDMPIPFEVPMDVTISGEVAHTGTVLVETETFSRREYAAPILRRLGVQTFVCVPIKTASRVIGTLSLAHYKKIGVEAHLLVAATSQANYLAMLLDSLETRDALQRGEAELAAVYDQAPSVMCLFDDRLDIVRANRAAAEFAGCSQAELTSGQIFRALLHQKIGNGDATQNLRGILVDTLVSGKSRHRVRLEQSVAETNLVEGAPILLLSTGRIQTGGVNRVLMCLEDITSSVRAGRSWTFRATPSLCGIFRTGSFIGTRGPRDCTAGARPRRLEKPSMNWTWRWISKNPPGRSKPCRSRRIGRVNCIKNRGTAGNGLSRAAGR